MSKVMKVHSVLSGPVGIDDMSGGMGFIGGREFDNDRNSWKVWLVTDCCFRAI